MACPLINLSGNDDMRKMRVIDLQEIILFHQFRALHTNSATKAYSESSLALLAIKQRFGSGRVCKTLVYT